MCRRAGIEGILKHMANSICQTDQRHRKLHESNKVMVLGSKSGSLVNLSVMSVLRKYFILTGDLQQPEDVCCWDPSEILAYILCQKVTGSSPLTADMFGPWQLCNSTSAALSAISIF